MSKDSKLSQTEGTFTTFDDTALFYRAWHPQEQVQQKALVLFHGGHEHSGRFDDLVERLALDNISIFAWDARGHGRSSGIRGYVDHYMDIVRDMDAFIHYLTAHYDIAPTEMVLMGHSVGSVTIATWLHDYATKVKGAVLGAPAFDIKLYIPFAYPALKFWQKISPYGFIKSYVQPKMLTHDQDEIVTRLNDQLISADIAVRVLTSVHDTAKRIVDDAQVITVPTLVLSAGSDWVVKRGAQEKFVQNLASTEKELSVYPGFFHEIYHEAERARPIARAKAFITACFSEQKSEMLVTDIVSNQAQYQALHLPLPAMSWKKYYFASTAYLLKHLGAKLSKGMEIGWQSGFDSGQMLNYVYDNKAHGLTPVGKWIDRQYLNSVGWAGIRQRSEDLKATLKEAISLLSSEHEALHIMDVAAGPGRYLLEVLAELKQTSLSALCRDMDESGLEEGRRLAESKGLASVVNYELADAFDPESINAATQAQIVVISGLYELFSNNEKLKISLQALYDHLPEGGILIYTNQPWHPQLELIGRTLINREQQPWIMRPRSQAEMNQLVQSVGFKPQKMRIGDSGIFTVTWAQK